METKIMLLCKKTFFCKYAIKLLESYYQKDEIHIVSGSDGSRLNDELHRYKPDYVMSFLSPWIIPNSLLSAAQKAAINFHPGSPRYPGSGCYNFALYEKAKQYGATCHHMEEKVDTGNIIMTSYFDISPCETVESLKMKSMNHLIMIFEKIIQNIHMHDTLPISNEKWQCSPYTKKQLNELRRIDLNSMNSEEIILRMHATDYCRTSGLSVKSQRLGKGFPQPGC
jgi:methionyl-tRNA formyltransferase